MHTNTQTNGETTTSKATAESSAEHQDGITILFARLHAFYGSKWLDNMAGQSTDVVKAIWLEELQAMRLTRGEIAAGVNGCRTLKWPPTLPEFLALCRPPLDPASSWYRAQYGLKARAQGEAGFTDPVLFEAARNMASELRSGESHEKYLERWRHELERAAEAHKTNPLPIPQAPPKKLPEAPAPKADPAKVAEAMAKMHVSVGRPGTQWAVRLREREQAGDKLTKAQRDMWRAALKADPPTRDAQEGQLMGHFNLPPLPTTKDERHDVHGRPGDEAGAP